MNFKIAIFAALVLLLPSVGCAGGGRYANSKYTWFHPGNLYQQRQRATVHDPFPDQKAGPEIVGGRPRDYSSQLPEPVRTRPYMDGGRNR